MIWTRVPIKSLCVLSTLVLLCSLSGCATYRITVPDSDPLGNYHSKTMHAYFWGLSMDPQVFSAECEGEGINDVQVVRNYGHDLISVITLGIWMPIDVRFRCKAPPIDGGEFPE